jgi:hypothetical protein
VTDELDFNDFTPTERIEAMEYAIQQAQADPEFYEDEDWDEEDGYIDAEEAFETALKQDLDGIARELGRDLTNREAEKLIQYAVTTGNTPSDHLDELGIKHRDMSNSLDRIGAAAEMLKDDAEKHGVGVGDVLTGDLQGDQEGEDE